MIKKIEDTVSILSISELNKITPKSLYILENTRFQRNHYKTLSDSEIVLVTSKVHEENGQPFFWFNLNAESYFRSQAEYVFIVCGKLGVCVTPITEIRNIVDGARWKALKSTKSYYVDLVRTEKGIYVKSNNYNLTKYFIAYTL